MHTMTIFPLGNADCCRIDLENGKKLLVDCAATGDPSDPNDKRCDLHQLLRSDLEDADRDNLDVVVFTHLDRDHFQGATEFFYLEHAAKYQTAGRIKMDSMWVPAAVITESAPDDDEARILQREARHRFKNNSGIRVFSRPERLEDWCTSNGLSLEERLHRITDAGQLVPEFSIVRDGVEFFVHSPFAMHQDDNTVEDRNADGIVLHATFIVDGIATKALLMADADHEVLADIVEVTRYKGNDDRLEWDIAKLPHHCSYLSLGPDKGSDVTPPVEEVDWLYAEQSQEGALIISTSKPIPARGSQEDEDPQPPHRQAANYYHSALEDIDGQLVVTMEHPTKRKPEPVIIEIGGQGPTLEMRTTSAPAVITSRPAPRAG